MQKTILQVPLDKQLKTNTEKVATEQGFSSLQEIIRVFLAQLAANKVEITLQESMTLTPANEDRYLEMTKDFESGKNSHYAENTEELLSKLNEN